MTVKTQNTMMVSVPPRPTGLDLAVSIARLSTEAPDEVVVYGTGIEFLAPLDVCGLRALLDRAAETATSVVFHCPTRADVHRYLARIDFYADLPANVTLTDAPPPMRRFARREQLVEVTRIRTSDEVEQLGDRVWRVAHAHFDGGPAALATATAIAAATENTIDHAASSIGALVSAQRYSSSGVELAVVDLGHGIPTTLRTNSAYTELSDLAALTLALDDGVSSVGDDGRGAGLAELVRGVSRARNATLRLRSGRAELTLGWAEGHARRSGATPAQPVPGTWISVRLEP